MQYANNDQTESGSNIRRIRVWLELGGPDGSGSVEVGQATTLGIKAVLPGSIGVRIVDCAALDGLGELSQKLLDERGCPVDEQVSNLIMYTLFIFFLFFVVVHFCTFTGNRQLSTVQFSSSYVVMAN